MVVIVPARAPSVPQTAQCFPDGIDTVDGLIILFHEQRGRLVFRPVRGTFDAVKEMPMTRSLRCIVAGALLLMLAVPGCAVLTRSPRATVLLNYPHATEANLTQSPHEHFQHISNIAAQDGNALVEDLDLVFMTDRPTRLTRWHSR